MPPLGLSFKATLVRGGDQVVPLSGLLRKKMPALPSVQLTYTWLPEFWTLGSCAFPPSLLKLYAWTNVGAAVEAEDRLKAEKADSKKSAITDTDKALFCSAFKVGLVKSFFRKFRI